jgi:hypothetical protein
MSKAGRALSGAASGAAAGTAVLPGIGTAIGGIIGGIGGLFGGGDAEEEEAKRLRNEALREIQGLSLPTIEELQIQLETLRSQGELTPELEQAFLQEASKMEGISSDPRLKEAQMGALAKLQQLGSEGLGAQDRLRLNDARRTVATDARARDEAILQNMASRGAGGSGVELAARLSSSQGQADRAGQEADRIAAMANQQALEAIMKGGQLGGDIRSQEFNQASQVAQAQDAINRFNAANRQNVEGINVAARNNAQMQNLQNAQRIADSNVGTRNAQNKYNRDVVTDDYNRRLNKAKAVANQSETSATAAQAYADRANSEVGGVISGLSGAIAGAGQAGLFKGSGSTSGGGDGAETDDTGGLAQRMRR